MAAILDFRLATFDLQVTLMLLPTELKVGWPFCSGEGSKNRL